MIYVCRLYRRLRRFEYATISRRDALNIALRHWRATRGMQRLDR